MIEYQVLIRLHAKNTQDEGLLCSKDYKSVDNNKKTNYKLRESYLLKYI